VRIAFIYPATDFDKRYHAAALEELRAARSPELKAAL
jgi:hypothetical protein